MEALMTEFIVRPFRKSDRDQVARLVNAHSAAVLPGCAVSVNTVLSQFEREPGEFIVDPWVAERVPMVAQQDGSIVAAALLVRYRNEPDVGEALRGAGEIRWLVFWPVAPKGNQYWSDGHEAAEAIAVSSIGQFSRWDCTRHIADGSLPAPGIYGVPEQWPHVASLLLRHGFSPARTETVLIADLADLCALVVAPVPELTIHRSVGINGTRCSATIAGDLVGYIEVDRLDRPERSVGTAFGDIGNLWVREDLRRRGIATQLLRYGARWLADGGAQRLLAYTAPNESDEIAFLGHVGFERATNTQLGWTRPLRSDQRPRTS
jgi:GNAT superfamily N-acetyltransferase